MIQGIGALEQYRINKLKQRYGMNKKNWKLIRLNYGIGRYHEPAKFTFRIKEVENE